LRGIPPARRGRYFNIAFILFAFTWPSERPSWPPQDEDAVPALLDRVLQAVDVELVAVDDLDDAVLALARAISSPVPWPGWAEMTEARP
jgi:hypothetical protein